MASPTTDFFPLLQSSISSMRRPPRRGSSSYLSPVGWMYTVTKIRWGIQRKTSFPLPLPESHSLRIYDWICKIFSESYGFIPLPWQVCQFHSLQYDPAVPLFFLLPYSPKSMVLLTLIVVFFIHTLYSIYYCSTATKVVTKKDKQEEQMFTTNNNLRSLKLSVNNKYVPQFEGSFTLCSFQITCHFILVIRGCTYTYQFA